jgi:hypothetical protein
MEEQRAALTPSGRSPADVLGGGQTVAEALGSLDWAALSNDLIGWTLQYCETPTVSASHYGENLRVDCNLSPGPGSVGPSWTATPEPPQAVSTVLSYSASSYDSAVDGLHITSVDSTLASSLSGTITAGTASLSVVIHALLFLEANLHVAGDDLYSQSANIVDLTWNATYAVEQIGGKQFSVALSGQSSQDQSQVFDPGPLAPIGINADIVDMLRMIARNPVQPLATGLGPVFEYVLGPKSSG